MVGAPKGAGDRGSILFVLDASAEMGVGHAIRCQALAEEFSRRGFSAVQVGRMEVPWVVAAYRAAGISMLGDVSPVSAAGRPGVRAVVMDSYSLSVAESRGLASLGTPRLAIVDNSGRGLDAELYLEQNPHSTPRQLGVEANMAMCGMEFVLLRDLVRARRHRPWQRFAEAGRPRVAVVLGGTDPAFGAVRVAAILANLKRAMSVTIVAASDRHRHVLQTVRWAPSQDVRVIRPNPGLIDALAGADLVVTAAGSTVYELMALGLPTAACLVAANQASGYDHLVKRDLVTGLGPIEVLRRNPEHGAAQLRALLDDPTRMEGLALNGFHAVDGKGRERVASRLLSMMSR